MNDFVFGTLATDALRLAHVLELRSGVTHRSARRPRDPQPGEPVQLDLWVGPQQPFDRAWLYWSVDGSDPLGRVGVASQGQAAALQPAETSWDTLVWGYRRRFTVTLPGQPAGTVLRYRLSAADGDGNEVFADRGAWYALYVADDPPPEWAQDAIIYQIFVDRFNPGPRHSWQQPDSPSGFYGGRLAGITARLDHVASLGANVLWLTPIFPSPSHHGYDATDLFEIEPRLGTKADLAELLAAAHARSMRVLFDFVPNHWSSAHASFQAARNDRNSPYYRWYNFRHWPDEYEAFFDVPNLPQLNLRHPPARQHILDAAAYWLAFGVDGYRVDHAIGPSPDFWADFRRVTRQAHPDCWTFGEVVEPSDAQIAFEGLLDGCLDFMLLDAMRQTFVSGLWGAARFSTFLDRQEAFFPRTFSRPSFLDNHDMNRILWAVQGDKRKLKAAALCQFTLAGPPVIYYGTEVGLSQVLDVRQGDYIIPEEARLPMLWGSDQDGDLLSFYRDLCRLRNHEPALRRGVRQALDAGPHIVAYTVSHPSAGLAVFINLSGETRQVILGEDWRTVALSTGGCELQAVGGENHLQLAPTSGAILKP